MTGVLCIQSPDQGIKTLFATPSRKAVRAFSWRDAHAHDPGGGVPGRPCAKCRCKTSVRSTVAFLSTNTATHRREFGNLRQFE